jgi:hypothetical protein
MTAAVCVVVAGAQTYLLQVLNQIVSCWDHSLPTQQSGTFGAHLPNEGTTLLPTGQDQAPANTQSSPWTMS